MATKSGALTPGPELELLGDDHAPVPHRVFTASRSTAPSAVRGRASVNATAWGRLNRAIFDATKSLTCGAVYRPVFTSTTALMASPHLGSGMPYTHTPLTPGSCMITVSTSAG